MYRLKRYFYNLRSKTTLVLHNKFTKINWYKNWHKKRTSYLVHWLILIVYVVSIFSTMLPAPAEAALISRSLGKSTSVEFGEGTVQDILNENDALGMHIGKKVSTGSNSLDANLNGYNSSRSIVRDSNNKLHIVLIKYEANPREIYYSASSDEGTTWEIPALISTQPNAIGVLLKIDGNNRIHAFWAINDPNFQHIKHSYKDTSSGWSSANDLGDNFGDAAIADWQATSDGQYREANSGSLSNITSSGLVTRWNPLTQKLEDVPANKLASEGYNRGYQNYIYEARTNYILNSSLESDANSDGIADAFGTPYAPTITSYTKEVATSTVAAHGSKYQNFRSLVTSTPGSGFQVYTTGYTGFAAGESATCSAYLSGNSSGVTVNIGTRAYQDNTSLGQVNASLALTNTFTRASSTYANLPTGTNKVMCLVELGGIDSTDSPILNIDAIQLEKGNYPTPYIPTTATAVTRQAESVSVPTINKNYLRNNSFENDINLDNKPDYWTNRGGTAGAYTYSRNLGGISGNYYQNFKYTGQPSDSGSDAGIYQTTDPGTFAAGENAVASVNIKGSSIGVNIKLVIYARDVNSTSLGTVDCPITLSGSFQRATCNYLNLPANTSRVSIVIGARVSVDPGDSYDLDIDGAQIEKNNTATVYDSTEPWNTTEGTIIVVAGRQSTQTGDNFWPIQWITDGNNYIGLQDFDSAARGIVKNAGTAYISSSIAETNTPAVKAIGWKNGSPVYIYKDGVKSTGSGITVTPSTLATAYLGAGTVVSRVVVFPRQLTDSEITNISAKLANNYIENDFPAPEIDNSGNIQLVYNKGIGSGIGNRVWNGSAWTSIGSAVVPAVGDHKNQNTLISDDTVYYFYTLNSDNKRYYVRKSGGSWSTPTNISTFTISEANEVIDKNGNLWEFATDSSGTYKNIKYRKHSISGNSWDPNWASLDFDVTKNVQAPSSTVDSKNNVWVFYTVANEVFYKIFDGSSFGARVQYSNENNSNVGTWKNLANTFDGALTNFNYSNTSGWNGSGLSDDPYALQFDGSNDYVDLGKPGSLDLTTDLSLDFWFSTTSPGNQIIIGKNYSSSYYINIALTNGSSNISFWTGNKTINYLASGATLHTGDYHHVVATMSGGVKRLFVDGVKVAEASFQDPAQVDAYKVLIGRSETNAAMFKGNLSAVRIYNRALAEAEVSQNASGGANAVAGYTTNGLVVDLNAAKSNGIGFATDGQIGFPKVRYQSYFNNNPDRIDITYRRNSRFIPNSYTLYYGSIGSGTTGSYTSPESGVNVLTSNWIGGWDSNAFVSNVNIRPNTTVSYEIRSGSGTSVNNIVWNSWQPLGNINSSSGIGDRTFSVTDAAMPATNVLPINNNRFLQVKISLQSGDGTNTPTVYDYSINYLADENSPIWEYPSEVPAYTNASKSQALSSNSWTGLNSSAEVYFDWSGASEPAEESGISNYYVYFGKDITANPLTAGVDKGTQTEGLLTIETPVSGENYFLRVSVKDVAGNILNMPSGDSIFTYKFDNTKPTSPTDYSVTPIGWSTVDSFTVAWQPVSDSGSGASQIKGYEYKRAGGGDNWTYIPYSASTITVPAISSYQNGENLFYIRSIDNAGNYSGLDDPKDFTVIHYYFNGSAPTKPRNLSVSPQSSTTNNFSFSWDQPENFNNGLKGYYYSINNEPTVNNSVFTTSRTTGSIPAATQQGINRFYVVAVDSSDNVNWANFERIDFECTTTAPGVPGGLSLSDSSNRSTENWALTLGWNPSSGNVNHYNLYRSTDGNNFNLVGTSASTIYSENGLSNTSTYYYKVTGVDNAGAESVASSVLSKQPTGKFTEAPITLSGPEIKTTATSATIIWTTNRNSSSFVAYSKDNSFSESKGQLENVTSHKVVVTGLEPGTSYKFKTQSFDENRDYPLSDSFSTEYHLVTQAAPGILDVKIDDVRLSSVIVSWKTTTVATSKVIYGKNNIYDNVIEDKSSSQVTLHTVKIEGLDHSSSYHFKIYGSDTDGNQLVSDDYGFDTLVFPKISNLRFEQQKNASTSTLKTTWDSNVPVTSIVEYAEGDNGEYKEVSKSTFEERHSVLVSGLKDNTLYRMRVKGRDIYGNEAISDLNKVKTDFDTRPPEISEITTETSIVGYGTEAKSQVVVSWFTDEPSTSQVEYNEGVTGDSYSLQTQEDSSLTTSHVIIISDLKPSSSYYFRVKSKDGSKNEAKTSANSVLTEQARSSILDIIVKSFENTLGWLFGGTSR